MKLRFYSHLSPQKVAVFSKKAYMTTDCKIISIRSLPRFD